MMMQPSEKDYVVNWKTLAGVFIAVVTASLIVAKFNDEPYGQE